MEKKTLISVVILNYNGKKDTLECLDSLKKLKKSSFHITIIVVDNNSSDGSVKQIKKQFPDVKVIQNKSNLGFSEGNNIGIREALNNKADYVLLLNNDTTVHPNLVKELLKVAKQENVGIVSPKIYFLAGFEFHKDRYQKKDSGKVIWYAGGVIDWKNVLTSHRGVDQIDSGQFEKTEETQYATGCAMFISRPVFDKVGFFDPIYFAYFEDADFSLMAKKYKFKIMYAPKAVLWHKNASSFKGSGSKFQDFFVTRNRLIFGLRFASIRAKIALLKDSLTILLGDDKIKKKAIMSAIIRKTTSEKLVRDITKQI